MTAPVSSRGWVWILVRLWIGFVFTYAGWTKLIGPVEEFRGLIAQYEIIPYAFVPFIAYTLPWMECIFGIFLLTGYMIRPSAVILSLCSMGFAYLMMFYYFKNGKFPEDCGCFGAGSWIHFTGLEIMIIDTLQFLLGMRLSRAKNHRFTLDRFWAAHSS